MTTKPDLRMTPARPEPCGECPWRKSHPAGWLGGFSPEDFAACIVTDVPIACHLTCGGTGTPSLCTGALVHYANQCKSPRPSELRAAVNEVEPRDDVFRFTHEFLAHHKAAGVAPTRRMFEEDPEFESLAHGMLEPHLIAAARAGGKPIRDLPDAELDAILDEGRSHPRFREADAEKAARLSGHYEEA